MVRYTVLTFKTLGSLLALLLLLGFSYQQFQLWSDSKNFKPTGKLLAVDGINMHLDCRGNRGEDKPIIILEPGATLSGVSWEWVQGELSQRVRVCSYDRPGYGWSDQAEKPIDGLLVANKLHKLLEVSGEAGPYVLVGHSLGSLFSQVYNQLYSADVLGLVLIDPPGNKLSDAISPEVVEQSNTQLALLKAVSIGSYFGVSRFIDFFWKPKSTLPPEALGALKAHYGSTKHIQTLHQHIQAFPEIVRQTKQGIGLKGKPLLVLSAEIGAPNFRAIGITPELHQQLASTSEKGEHYVLPKSDHYSITLTKSGAEETVGLITRWMLKHELLEL